LKGEITSPINLPKACRFASRCLYATKQCFGEEPDLKESAPGHQVACFLKDKPEG
ncbi:MAG: peptide ABC transporter ATP-binding protein, partial [Clostridia bacterium]|nr:peptide ABC transporter ATP-binding protein [Clostridia bacterium]